MKSPYMLAAASLALLAAPASAQSASTGNSTTDRIGQILGSILGDRVTGDVSLDAQWRLGRQPIAGQRVSFEARVDAAVRAGQLSTTSARRLRADYAALENLEARYGADGQFSAAERSDLSERYGALTRSLTDGSYADDGNVDGDATTSASVAMGQSEFDARVDAAVSARRLTRVTANRIKADYRSLIQLESSYLRDGVISAREQNDLDVRLDALDARVGDTGYSATPQTPRDRIDAITRALSGSGLSVSAQSQLRVELGDLARLEAAYARLGMSADDRGYLDRRLADLEMRARIRR